VRERRERGRRELEIEMDKRDEIEEEYFGIRRRLEREGGDEKEWMGKLEDLERELERNRKEIRRRERELGDDE